LSNFKEYSIFDMCIFLSVFTENVPAVVLLPMDSFVFLDVKFLVEK
jgi:hypothetical protein